MIISNKRRNRARQTAKNFLVIKVVIPIEKVNFSHSKVNYWFYWFEIGCNYNSCFRLRFLWSCEAVRRWLNEKVPRHNRVCCCCLQPSSRIPNWIQEFPHQEPPHKFTTEHHFKAKPKNILNRFTLVVNERERKNGCRDTVWCWAQSRLFKVGYFQPWIFSPILFASKIYQRGRAV